MKKLFACLAIVAMSCVAVSAEELKSGLAAGEVIGAFQVVKVAGAEGDGLAEKGDQLCYRCKYGPRPQVMVFTRKTDGQVASLTKELNTAVGANSDKKLAAFVNVLGADKDAAEKGAKDLAAHSDVKNVPVVVPVESENGPANYGLNPDAEVTVIIANKTKVVASMGFAAGKLDDAAIASVIKQVKSAIE
ncbi:MAG: hypothetical protein C0483_05675 [Pirellula sp.]|nr:hypothetical protein [Pirellula sp.]